MKGLDMMKNRLTVVVGLLIVAGLLAFMLCFQVRYDEYAVCTTFGAAGAGATKERPGFYFRLPPPVQKVYKFPRRVQVLEDQLEELQTADGYSVVTRTYLAWRIKDPLAFLKKDLQNVEKAQELLRPFLRDLRKIVSRYRFDELVNTDPAKLKLVEIETEAASAVAKHLNEQGYGIGVEQLGIRRLVLPEQVTQKVFDRMKQTRQTMAQMARSEGEAQSVAIKNEAESTRKIILAFAENRAAAIRAMGDREASEYYKAFKEDGELAVFLRRMEMLQKVLPNHTTFVLDAGDLGFKGLFQESTGKK